MLHEDCGVPFPEELLPLQRKLLTFIDAFAGLVFQLLLQEDFRPPDSPASDSYQP